jgi:hypothetical protein
MTLRLLPAALLASVLAAALAPSALSAADSLPDRHRGDALIVADRLLDVRTGRWLETSTSW